MRSDAFWEWFDQLREKLGKRADTFAKMFEYLDGCSPPICIIETGCVRSQDNWDGDGQSTVLFDQYANTHLGCTVHSVDIDPSATGLALSNTKNVRVHTGDSVEFLKNYAANPHVPEIDFSDISSILNSGRVLVSDSLHGKDSQIDLLYLDSFDFTPDLQIESAVHHINELLAALPAISPQTLVAVDDTIFGNDDINGWGVHGKGTLVYDYALAHAAELRFSGYQIGWTGMVRDQPYTLEELVLRARAHVEAGEPLAADQLYRLIQQVTSPPEYGMAQIANGEATAWFARQAVARRRYSLGAEYYRAALAVDPMATEYRAEMCKNALIPAGDLKEALLESKRATAVDPGLKDAWHVLGGVYHAIGDWKKSVEIYDKQIQLFPDDSDAMIDRMTIALDLEQYDLVKDFGNKIIGPAPIEANEAAPDMARVATRVADAYCCLGLVAYRENRHEDAIELFDRAIAGDCYNHQKAHWHKSISLHSLGRLREGWKEHEHRRFILSELSMSLPARRFTRPMWEGQPPPARIHAHSEAGAGDNLCLARYLPILVERGYTVCYETEPSMVELFTRSFPTVEVIAKAPNWPGAIGIKDFDYHIPIGTLPASFETDLDTIPCNVPYLMPNQELVEKYRKLVPTGSIGLCWSAGIRDGVWLERYGKNKSMSLVDMFPIFKRCHCVSLQVGPERAEQRDFPIVKDVLPEEPSWDDTAALISCLCAVVTVDTGVAHLAGALGADVHLAMHTQGSWHWMSDIDGSSFQKSSPWYPSVRVHRQKTKGKWAPVIASIEGAITCRAHTTLP